MDPDFLTSGVATVTSTGCVAAFFSFSFTMVTGRCKIQMQWRCKRLCQVKSRCGVVVAVEAVTAFFNSCQAHPILGQNQKSVKNSAPAKVSLSQLSQSLKFCLNLSDKPARSKDKKYPYILLYQRKKEILFHIARSYHNTMNRHSIFRKSSVQYQEGEEEKRVVDDVFSDEGTRRHSYTPSRAAVAAKTPSKASTPCKASNRFKMESMVLGTLDPFECPIRQNDDDERYVS